MPVVKLSQRYVDGLPPTDKLTLFFDTALTGFGVYTKGKAKTYFVQARAKQKLIKATIGKASLFSLEEARKQAKIKLGMMANGINPVAEKRQEEKQNTTLSDILKEYLEINKELKESSQNFYRLCVDTYLKDWKDRPIRLITEEDVKKRHKMISTKLPVPKSEPVEQPPDPTEPKKRKKRARTNGPGIADGVMKTLRALLNHAIDEHPEIISINPVSKLKKRWNKLKPRETQLRQDQLHGWINAVKASQNHAVRDVLQLILFTGLRSKTEAFPLKWNEIDFTSKTMHFFDTKNKSTLVLPMNTAVYDLLKERHNHLKESEYVFPSVTGKGHITDIRKELDKINKASNVAKLTPHSLRHTFSTYAEYLDISPFAIKALLNHSDNKKRDTTAGYIHVSQERILKASQMVADYICQIIIEAEELINQSKNLKSLG
jgi:integrase